MRGGWELGRRLPGRGGAGQDTGALPRAGSHGESTHFDVQVQHVVLVQVADPLQDLPHVGAHLPEQRRGGDGTQGTITVPSAPRGTRQGTERAVTSLWAWRNVPGRGQPPTSPAALSTPQLCPARSHPPRTRTPRASSPSCPAARPRHSWALVKEHRSAVPPSAPCCHAPTLPTRVPPATQSRRIQLHHHDDGVLLLEGVVEEDDALVVQLREDVQLPARRLLGLGPAGDELGGEVQPAALLRHPPQVGESPPATWGGMERGWQGSWRHPRPCRHWGLQGAAPGAPGPPLGDLVAPYLPISSCTS